MTRVRTIKAAARAWWVLVAAVVVVLALVLVSGGFATVSGAQGRPAGAEEELSLTRWVLVVHSAELVDGNEYEPADPADLRPPKVRVRLLATYDGEKSTYGLGPKLVTVQGPPGTAPLDDSPYPEGERDTNVDPGVAREMILTFSWPDAPTESPSTIRVQIRDEELKDNFIYAPEWGARAAPSVHVDLPCPDLRTR